MCGGGWFFVWTGVVLRMGVRGVLLVLWCVVLFVLCVCVSDLFLFLQVTGSPESYLSQSV